MNKIAKRYYDLAFDYHLSALTLWAQIFEAPYIFNPTLFLLRHTAELLLKGLIVDEHLKNSTLQHVNLIQITENNNTKNINACHSLLYLWENFKLIQKQYRLVACFDKKQEKFIDTTIKYFNDKDCNSTTFRYPYTKKEAKIVIEPLDFDTSQIATELDANPPTIIQYGEKAYIIKKGITYITQALKLFDVIELLFQYSGY